MTDWRERRLGAHVRRHLEKRDKAARRLKGSADKPVIFALRSEARNHAEKALNALANLMEAAASEHARISAANAILDRGYGRPMTGAQAAEYEPDDDDETEDEDDDFEVVWLGKDS